MGKFVRKTTAIMRIFQHRKRLWQSNIDLREGLCSAVFVKTRVGGGCSVSWAHKPPLGRYRMRVGEGGSRRSKTPAFHTLHFRLPPFFPWLPPFSQLLSRLPYPSRPLFSRSFCPLFSPAWQVFSYDFVITKHIWTIVWKLSFTWNPFFGSIVVGIKCK